MPNLGPTELIIILVIVIAIFGAGKLANLGGALGKGVKDFRQAVEEGQKQEDEQAQEAKPATSAQTTEKEPRGEESGEEA